MSEGNYKWVNWEEFDFEQMLIMLDRLSVRLEPDWGLSTLRHLVEKCNYQSSLTKDPELGSFLLESASGIQSYINEMEEFSNQLIKIAPVLEELTIMARYKKSNIPWEEQPKDWDEYDYSGIYGDFSRIVTRLSEEGIGDLLSYVVDGFYMHSALTEENNLDVFLKKVGDTILSHQDEMREYGKKLGELGLNLKRLMYKAIAYKAYKGKEEK